MDDHPLFIIVALSSFISVFISSVACFKLYLLSNKNANDISNENPKENPNAKYTKVVDANTNISQLNEVVVDHRPSKSIPIPKPTAPLLPNRTY